MNTSALQAAIRTYLDEVKAQFYTGHAKEHAYRPALQRLMATLDDCDAVNDPKRSENGNPDFVFLKKSNNNIILGHAEAKDVDVSLDKTEKSDQMHRYGGYANLYLTNYLEFRFYRNGEKYKTLSLGEVKNSTLYLHDDPQIIAMLADELAAFITQPPEKIRSGKRLAGIMGGKARRIRDDVITYLNDDAHPKQELEKMYGMMQRLLVHDLTREKFADMYAQTLVYGLFVARYGDTTPESFSRSEARDLVPASNPFLRQFFDHIVGPNFDQDLAYVVDELCEVFSVSPVQDIVHKHLRIQDTTSDAKDPIIHFYEDFLQEYDPLERKRMGAYYTPIPVVRYIIRQVDRILKEDFGISKGLASSETIQYEVETGQDLRVDRRTKAKTTQTLTLPRVQVLDPAVGTATFLNETIKFIHDEFKGQEGRWPAYVADNLVKRLHGFELMMAPYTIAHLKLGMTLRETGVDKLNDRLGVYLTNTLEEGVPTQGDMFAIFGLAEAVADESRHAAEIKSERPIMVVMGNPPYSVESSNKTKYADSLIDKYRVEPGGIQKLQERNSKMLGDDYVKFISFAENMVKKNKEGIVAFITNNGYLSNPTFRGMRWHLANTFDKIYVLDLHGNANKKEMSPDGSRDDNVFDIMQGVSIIVAVKTKTSETLRNPARHPELDSGSNPEKSIGHPAEIYHADLYGTRADKFTSLSGDINFVKINPDIKHVLFIPNNSTGLKSYNQGISVDSLFNVKAAGIKTSMDGVSIAITKEALFDQVSSSELVNDYSPDKIQLITYRPFDQRYIYYSPEVVKRDRYNQIKHSLQQNISLLSGRQSKNGKISQFFITDNLSEMKTAESTTGSYHFPLYLYHEDGTRTPNLAPAEVSALFRNMPYLLEDLQNGKKEASAPETVTPESILDYCYAVLHSPTYRAKYKEFLKIDFPRIPAPADAIEYWQMSRHGHELRQLHLMKSPSIDDFVTTYPVAGSDEVQKISFVPNTTSSASHATGSVYINDTQYFGNVPHIAWEFYIGGYQPAQKWLKDRRGRTLSHEDLDHYQRIIKVLIATDRIMKEIDHRS